MKKYMLLFQILVSLIVAGILACMQISPVWSEAACVLPPPAVQSITSYVPVATPSSGTSCVASQIEPFGVGDAAVGGNTLSMQVGIPQFSSPVDIYFAYSVPGDQNIYILNSNNGAQPYQNGLVPWKSNTTGPVNVNLGDITIAPPASIPSGRYSVYLAVTPAGKNSFTVYDLWATYFDVPKSFYYVYSDYKAANNNFIASGWMDNSNSNYTSAISYNDDYKTGCYTGTSCIQSAFNPVSGITWAGMYWQYTENNWGDKPGHNLTGCTKIAFRAKGAQGGESIEFFAFGINRDPNTGTTTPTPTMPYYDSSPKVSLGSVSLSQSWQGYVIDITGKDLTNIIGGFGWVTDTAHNPKGATFYLDEIKYECSTVIQ